VSDLLDGGHAGESPYRHDPRDQLQLSYAFQPPDPDRIARAYPPRDRCAWSLEIVRRRARVMEIDNQIFAAVEAARARQLAEARYSEQRRQALAAILYGVVIMVLVIAAAGG
jgi:hypothetical protein